MTDFKMINVIYLSERQYGPSGRANWLVCDAIGVRHTAYSLKCDGGNWFIDESWFLLRHPGGKMCVYRRHAAHKKSTDWVVAALRHAYT